MRFLDAYRMAQQLATANREAYVVSIKRGRQLVLWCAEPKWLYDTMQGERRNALFVYADSPADPPESTVSLCEAGERS